MIPPTTDRATCQAPNVGWTDKRCTAPAKDGTAYCRRHQKMFGATPSPTPAPAGTGTAMDWSKDDDENVRGLILVCADLKDRLVPFGSRPEAWDSAIETLDRVATLTRQLAEAQQDTARLNRLFEDGRSWFTGRAVEATAGPVRSREQFDRYVELYDASVPTTPDREG